MAGRMRILRVGRMALAPSPPAPLPLKGVRGVMPRSRQRRVLILSSPSTCDGEVAGGAIAATDGGGWPFERHARPRAPSVSCCATATSPCRGGFGRCRD